MLSGHRAVEVHLQPVVDLRTGGVWGVEALARFPGHPRPGPDAWFRSAVRDGRGVALEELALVRTLDLLALLPQGLHLTVNLSARALLEPAVQALLVSTPRSLLLVELTEHERVADYPALLSALEVLRTAGIGLAIDDFGAGHSSAQHVLNLEPDLVKLDLALVQGVGACSRRQALVEAMLMFARRTDAVLVAEGVERAEDLQALSRLGVELAQGYFLARPAAPEAVLPDLEVASPTVLVLP